MNTEWSQNSAVVYKCSAFSGLLIFSMYFDANSTYFSDNKQQKEKRAQRLRLL